MKGGDNLKKVALGLTLVVALAVGTVVGANNGSDTAGNTPIGGASIKQDEVHIAGNAPIGGA